MWAKVFTSVVVNLLVNYIAILYHSETVAYDLEIWFRNKTHTKYFLQRSSFVYPNWMTLLKIMYMHNLMCCTYVLLHIVSQCYGCSL